jgi:type I restriction enzyme S subunit
MQHEPLLKAAPFSGSRVQPFDGTKRYLSTGDLQEATTSFVEVTYADKPSRADISVRPGDVLFARMKGTKKVLEVDRSLAGIIVSTGFAVLRPTEECNGKFLSLYLKSDDFERQKEKYCSGAIQPAITNAGIKNLTIPFPPLDDQKRIAQLLGKVEGLIARRKQHLQQLDDLLKSVFLEMFSPQSPGYDDWPIVEIKDLAAKHKGAMRTGPFGSNLLHSEFTAEGDVAVLGIDNAVQNRFAWGEPRFINYEKYQEIKNCRIFPGDVIVTIMGTIGRSAVIPDDIPLAINTKHLAAITLNKEIANPLFISYSIHSSPFILKQFKSKNRGAIMSGLNLGLIKETKLKRPPIELQNQFAAIHTRIDEIKSRYQQSLTDLESLYGALSQKAFKGELNLSRMVLSVESTTEDTDSTEGLNRETRERRETGKDKFELPVPDDSESVKSTEGRKTLIDTWLNAWLEHQGDAPFAAQAFMDAARQRLWDLTEDNAPDWGAAEYDELKAWVFEALEQGRLTQGYDDANNRVQLKAAGK